MNKLNINELIEYSKNLSGSGTFDTLLKNILFNFQCWVPDIT